MKIVTVYDSAAEVYSLPQCVISKGAALRSFMDAVQKPDHEFNKHPEHFSMFVIGEFDQQSARVTLLPSPELLGNAWELTK